MSKWTPWPWNYPEHPKGVSTLIYAELGGNPEAFPVASATYGVPDEERKANARLIAAAPDLLEALRKYELPIDINNIALSCIEFGSEAVERELQRRAAIAKATGEPQ